MPLAKVSSPAERQRFGLVGYARKWKHNTLNYEEAQKLSFAFTGMLKPEISNAYENESVWDDVVDIPWNVRQKVYYARNIVRHCILCLGDLF